MVSYVRYAFLGLVWLYLAGIVVQTFLAGAALFSPGRDFELHRTLGYLLHLAPIGLLLVALVGRLGRDIITWTVALLVVQGIQPLLPMLRTDYPLVAALHPVLVLAIFWLGITIGLKAWRLVNSPAPRSAQEA
jgi:Family of unknown function (DUF6220)